MCSGHHSCRKYSIKRSSTASCELRRAVTAALRRQRNCHRALGAVFRRGRGRGFRFLGPAVHLMDDKEYGERYDQEIDHVIDEDSVVQGRLWRGGRPVRPASNENRV